MKQNKYLIIAEIKRTGFIIETKESFLEAFDSANALYLSLSNRFPVNKRNKIADTFLKRHYTSYKINGTELYFGKCKDQITDGILTISVVEIDCKEFNLQMLIRERENHSLVFNTSESIDQLDKLAEIFPDLDIIAN